jgi:hypothetical protein
VKSKGNHTRHVGSSAVAKMTINNLHHHMGHINHKYLWKAMSQAW